MKETLLTKLHQYMAENNPDLLITLQQEGKVVSYLQEKVAAIEPLSEQLQADGTPAYIIEQRCMEELTADLRPSKYNYISAVLEDEFSLDYSCFQRDGLLTYEVINLVEACRPVLDELGFTEANEDDPQLRNTIIGAIKEYLDNKQ